MTQNERVIQYMTETGSITALEAIRELGVLRLAARISDLRKEGHLITASTESGKNRYGDACHWVRYRLVKDG